MREAVARFARCASGCVAVLALMVLVGCGGGEDDPTVQSFSSPQAEGAAAGATVLLVAEFAGGTGVIDAGIGEVRSGVPVEVTLERTTTYTLTVTNGAGVAVTRQLQVPVIFRAEWALDGASDDWVLVTTNGVAARYERGGLSLAGGDREILDESGFSNYVCATGTAEHRFTDAGLVDGRYATLTVELLGTGVWGSGMGYPYAYLTYGGWRYSVRVPEVFDGSAPTLRMVVTLADRKIRTYLNGELTGESSGQADAGPPGLKLQAAGCAPDFGSANLTVDAVALEAR